MNKLKQTIFTRVYKYICVWVYICTSNENDLKENTISKKTNNQKETGQNEEKSPMLL